MNQGIETAHSPLEIVKRLNLHFNDVLLLNRAFTHRSYLNEHPEAIEDNERLEFLGDAVLDFLVGAWLYNRFPEMAEGGLTRLRSALVRTEQLSKFAISIGLNKALKLGRGEAESGGRERQALACALFEAFVGALYLDAGIVAVSKFIEPLLESVVGDLIENGSLQDPKSKLQEWAQASHGNAPVYKTVNSYGPDHAKVFDVVVLVDGEVLGKGTGHSKQAAAKEAARDALRKFHLE